MKLIIFACSLYFLFDFASGAHVPEPEAKPEHFDCFTYSSRFKPNDCYECFCAPAGILVCHLTGCTKMPEPDCEPGTSWMQDCNKCWCIQFGKICNDKKC